MQSNNELPFDQRPTLKLVRRPQPLPSRTKTLIGITLDRDVVDSIRRTSQESIDISFPVKYHCTLTTDSGTMCTAVVITHLDLQDWLDLNGLYLFSIDAPPELAEKGERTRIG